MGGVAWLLIKHFKVERLQCYHAITPRRGEPKLHKCRAEAASLVPRGLTLFDCNC